tara:strand:+ start:549 stop:1418 length:870 start_codon:yes stop_codon:yes gene_type:complete
MLKKLNKIANDTNNYLINYLKKQSKSELIKPMKYGLLPGGKKIRSKILIDTGKIFNVKYKNLIQVGAAVECIHAYSLIHDDLPCMDDDDLRRGKPSTHKKYGEATAVLAGNSLLTLAFEILSDKNLNLKDKIKVKLINLISECSGHSGIAGGQYLDLSYEKKKISLNKIIQMQIKKTSGLFIYCCVVPAIISGKNEKIKNLKRIGSDVGLLFQIVDDLIDYKGNYKIAGKKTNKDKKRGKATLINILGYDNTLKYANNLKKNITISLNKLGKNAEDFKKTIDFIFNRKK